MEFKSISFSEHKYDFKESVYIETEEKIHFPIEVGNYLNLSSKSMRKLATFKAAYLKELQNESCDVNLIDYAKAYLYKNENDYTTEHKNTPNYDKVVSNRVTEYIIELKTDDLTEFKKLRELFLLLFNSTRRIVRDTKTQYSAATNFYLNYFNVSKPSEIGSKLYSLNFEDYQKYKYYSNYVSFSSNNLDYSETYFKKFQKSLDLNHLQESVKLLQSICQYGIKFKGSNSGFDLKLGDKKKLVNYYSKNKFCAFSNYVKTTKLRETLISNLDRFNKKGYDSSFLTLSGCNLDNFTKDDITNTKNGYHKVIKEFWRIKVSKELFVNDKTGLIDSDLYELNKHHLGKSLSDIFPGYFGVCEIKEKKDFSFNWHYHYIVLRKKNKKQGFISNVILSNAFKSVANKFGNDKIKGSFSANIQRVKLYEENKNKGAVRYILGYLSKGVATLTHKGRDHLITNLHKVNLIRSGGLLFQNNLTQNKIKEEFDNEINELIDFNAKYGDNITLSQKPNILLGGKYINDLRKIDPIKIPSSEILDLFYKHKVPSNEFMIHSYLYEYIPAKPRKIHNMLKVKIIKIFNVGQKKGDILFMKKNDAINYQENELVEIFDINNLESLETKSSGTTKVLSPLYHEIKHSMQGSIPFLDPFMDFFFNKKQALKFGGICKSHISSWWDNPLFIIEAFKSLGHQEELKTICNDFNLPYNIDNVLSCDNVLNDMNIIKSGVAAQYFE